MAVRGPDIVPAAGMAKNIQDVYKRQVLTNRMEHPADVIDFSNQKVVTNAAREILMISRSPIPVSYTHLDVYKRQAIGFIATSEKGWHGGCTGNCPSCQEHCNDKQKKNPPKQQ